ncbi:MAG: MBL fold metallo-hydrolase [Chloroflexi bacterium]|nr:MBL fold metallo-hydrolase [Chloroflexota bacterium]
MELVIIGAGTPTPTAERFGSACLVDLGAERYLFDCGPATTHKLARAGYSPAAVNGLFFTHHHFDHDADYACFALSRWDQGGDTLPALRVWGPWPTAEVNRRLFGPSGAFIFDIVARVEHPLSQQVHRERGGALPRRPPSFEVNELTSGAAIEGQGWRVTCATVEHAQPFLESLAYRLESGGVSTVFAGDARPSDALADLARGADTLIVNVGVARGPETSLAVMDPTRAGLLASRAAVRRLVVTHLGARLTDAEGRRTMIAQVAASFAGEIVVADELMRLR